MEASYTERCNGEKYQKGSLILEIILTLAIFSLTVSSLSGLLFTLQSETIKTEDRRTALYMAASVIDTAMNNEAATGNFLSLVPTVSTTTMNATSTSPSFITNLFVQDLTPCKKILESTVSWPNTITPNATDSINMSLVATDPAEDKKLAGDCEGDEPSGSWASSTISAIPGQNQTISELDANNDLMVAISNAPNSKVMTFTYQKGVIPIQAGALALDSPVSSIDLAAKYAYLAANASTSQLKIINITAPAQPILAASTSLPGVSGSYPGGLSIFYYDSRVYVGTHRTAGKEFNIYNVSVPAAPVWLGAIELNHNINQIIVRGSYAYLATSGNTDDIIILDISNPASIKQISSLTFAGTEDTLSIFLIGTKLYAGRKKGSSASHPEFYVIDVSNPFKSTVISSLSIGSTLLALRVAGNDAYIATDNPLKTFLILNITDPLHISIIASKGLGTSGTDLDYESNTIFLAASSSLNVVSPS